MFQVLDNGKPAELKGSKLWSDSIFQFFEEAQEYAEYYMAEFGTCAPKRPDKKVDYSGRGDTIEIKSL